MGTASRTRPGQLSSGTGKGPSRRPKHLDQRRSIRASLGAATHHSPKPLSPATTTVSGPDRHSSESGSEEIAPEIVVWTSTMNNDAMSVDSDSLGSLTPPPPSPSPSPPLSPIPLPNVEVKLEPELGPIRKLQIEPQVEPEAEPEQLEVPRPAVPMPGEEPSPDETESTLESVLEAPAQIKPLSNSLPEPGAPSETALSPPPRTTPDPLVVTTQLSLPPATIDSRPSPVADPPPPPALLHPEAAAEQSSGTASSVSVVSDRSDTSDAVHSQTSKATTPIDLDSSKDFSMFTPRPSQQEPSEQPASTPRRAYNVRPKVSIPTDLLPADYAMQCVAAAEASRLNPYHLHNEEYRMLRDHISYSQVTAYLNIRNGILRLWVRNPQIPVTREEAAGCARDTRWFGVASLCFDWLVRRGFINFGCVEVRPARKQAGKDAAGSAKQRTVVVIGAGMAGLGCARQLEGLFLQYSKKFRDLGEEPPRVVVLEGRNRVGGRVYSKEFKTKPKYPLDGFQDKRCTAEMGGMIITGFDRGNPMNILVRGQLSLPYRPLRPDTTLYDSSGKPVDTERDQLVENLYNDCLDRVSEYKFKQPASKLIEGNRDLMDEGRESAAETHKTIRQTDETAAAQPHALPVSEQNIAPQVNLVAVSTDRATGKIHTEPGTPGALKAAHKAKLMGWLLKPGVGEEADIDIEPATKEPNATLGSVTDAVIAKYKDLVDLTAQDFRLMNWHVANLEYSNATNYHQLSLQGWDIDAGNEWEGSHTMVIGGYQSVPRGLMQVPTPLDIRKQSPVTKISYAPAGSNGPATVECENGTKIEADFVVSTIPLGVMKHGNLLFEPPLPAWKSDVIGRLGFGVLNKVILVYKEPFWDQDRDIFGVLRSPTNRNSLDQKDYASQRGRFFQWFNVTKTSGLPVLLALMAGDAGNDTEQTCNDDLVTEATTILRSVYGDKVPEPVEAVVTRWASDKFARGSYSSAGPDMKADDYDTMARPIGNLFFAGEHTCGTHPATVHGAYLSGLRAASEVLDVMLGPIEIPTPLIVPKETSQSLKRKAAESKNPIQARLEAYEIELWDHIIVRIGLRPMVPSKPATNAYIFYSRAHYEDARKKLEEGRRPGKGKASANEVRVMSAKMWRDTSEEERKPFIEMAEEQKRKHAAAMAEFKEKAAEWDRKATELKAQYEKDHPPPENNTLIEGERRSKKRVESYAEDTSDSDIDME